MARPKLLDDYTIQAVSGGIVTTLAGAVFTAPNGLPFAICNETDIDAMILCTFAGNSVAVNKKFKSGDNAYVLKSFTMPNHAVALFYLQ